VERTACAEGPGAWYPGRPRFARAGSAVWESKPTECSVAVTSSTLTKSWAGQLERAGTGPIPAGFEGFEGRAANQPGTYQIRTFPKTLTSLTVDIPRNWDLRIQKTFNIRERAKVIFSADALNVTNHTQFGGPDINPVDAAFGTVSVQRNVPRFIELTLRVQF